VEPAPVFAVPAPGTAVPALVPPAVVYNADKLVVVLLILLQLNVIHQGRTVAVLMVVALVLAAAEKALIVAVKIAGIIILATNVLTVIFAAVLIVCLVEKAAVVGHALVAMVVAKDDLCLGDKDMKKISLGLIVSMMILPVFSFAQTDSPSSLQTDTQTIPKEPASLVAFNKEEMAKRSALDKQIEADREAFFSAHPDAKAYVEELKAIVKARVDAWKIQHPDETPPKTLYEISSNGASYSINN